MTKLLYVDCETTMSGELREITLKPYIDGKMKKGATILLKYNSKHGTKAQQEQHNNVALTRQAAFNKMINYLNAFIERRNSNDKFVIVAHNAKHDIDTIFNFFKDMGSNFFASYFYYHGICTIQMMLIYLTLTNKVNQVNSFKLDDICAFWGIDVDKELRHTSKYDVELLVKVYKKIENELRKLR